MRGKRCWSLIMKDRPLDLSIPLAKIVDLTDLTEDQVNTLTIIYDLVLSKHKSIKIMVNDISLIPQAVKLAEHYRFIPYIEQCDGGFYVTFNDYFGVAYTKRERLEVVQRRMKMEVLK